MTDDKEVKIIVDSLNLKKEIKKDNYLKIDYLHIGGDDKIVIIGLSYIRLEVKRDINQVKILFVYIYCQEVARIGNLLDDQVVIKILNHLIVICKKVSILGINKRGKTT